MPLVKWFFQVWSESGGGWSVTASCTASMSSGSWLQLRARRSTVLSSSGTWSTSTVSGGVAQRLHDPADALEAFLKPVFCRRCIQQRAELSPVVHQVACLALVHGLLP